MNRTDDANTIEYLPAETSSRREDVAARYRMRQHARKRMPMAQKPMKAPADQVSFLGGKKESPAVQRHNRQLDTIEFAAVESGYAIQCGVELEYVAVRDSSTAMSAMVDTLMELPPRSLEYAVTEQLVMDGAERIRALNGDATEQYRRRVFGS